MRVVIPLTMMLFLSPLAAQQLGEVPERHGDLDRDIGATVRMIEALPDTKMPEVAEAALGISSVFLSPEDTLSVTLRNDGRRAITAYSLGIVVGFSDGESLHRSYSEDSYLPTSLDGRCGVLHPGRSRVIRVPSVSTSSDSRGDYPVLDVVANSVMFDDGEFAGRDLNGMKSLIWGRYLRAALLADMLTRLRQSLRTGTEHSFLDESLRIHEASQAIRPTWGTQLAGIGAEIGQILERANYEWLSSLHMFAWRSGALPDLGPDIDDVRALKSRPESFRAAVAETVPYLQNDLDLVHSHLPADMRPGRTAR